MPIVRILAISGSLRSASLNSALLRAVAGLAPADVRIELYTELGNLPRFNPDLEITDTPQLPIFTPVFSKPMVLLLPARNTLAA
ncbi:NAD(P)H-dependent oxidoreductase [Methylobacter sp. G7]|uniref:NADPH-dependent FMN reductase n=1 Tax=Methylobacter sp. G7 TaxID=3230117 RepID=UPI003D80728E